MYIYISDFGRHGKSFTTDFLKYLLNQMNEGETDKGCWFGVFKVLNKLASSPVAASPRLHLGFFASCGNLISIDIPFWMGWWSMESCVFNLGAKMQYCLFVISVTYIYIHISRIVGVQIAFCTIWHLNSEKVGWEMLELENPPSFYSKTLSPHRNSVARLNDCRGWPVYDRNYAAWGCESL